MGDNKRLIIGKLIKPHGLKGEIRMHYYGNDPEGLSNICQVRVIKNNDDIVNLEFDRVRVSKNALILKFKGIDSIDDALELVGGDVQINKSDLAIPNEDEYFWDDLIGMAVYDENGALLGKIESILESGGADIYVVKRGKKELLIPAVKDVVKTVDVEKKIMHVHLLEGMRDDF